MKKILYLILKRDMKRKLARKGFGHQFIKTVMEAFGFEEGVPKMKYPPSPPLPRPKPQPRNPSIFDRDNGFCRPDED